MRLRLASLDRARGEFIANASHELRTPLFSLAGFLELLDAEEVDAATREEFLAEMRGQVERLTKLATDLLDLSRIDAGRLDGRRRRHRPRRRRRRRSRRSSARARRRPGTRLELAGEVPVHARGDEARVLQIGRILAENAIVHTPPGTTVDAHGRRRAAAARRCR